jgi:hypothetical protein
MQVVMKRSELRLDPSRCSNEDGAARGERGKDSPARAAPLLEQQKWKQKQGEVRRKLECR